MQDTGAVGHIKRMPRVRTPYVRSVHIHDEAGAVSERVTPAGATDQADRANARAFTSS